MSLYTPERLYRLLPAFYRVRDAEQGAPLRALLAVIEGELERIEADTSVLYDNWFIETCEEWVVPYIGDLLGVRPVREIESAGVSARACVANTVAYRRRKGTAVVLEQLAHDVTGWSARAVEFYARLATAQHMNHLRMQPTATPSVRDAAQAELADSAFDPFSHTLEVRNAATRSGRFNVQNIGLFLWRLCSYEVGVGDPGDPSPDFASARRRGAYWTLHPAGVDAPLFNRPPAGRSFTHLAAEQHVPGALRRLALNAELERLRQGRATPPPVFMTDAASGAGPVLRVFVRRAKDTPPVEVPREGIYLCEIPDAVEHASPAPLALALDPARGRIAFPAGLDVREVWVQGSYGFSGDLGGGPYDRGAAVRAADRAVGIEVSAAGPAGGFRDHGVWQVGVSHLTPDDGSRKLFASLREAVAEWKKQPPGTTGVIVLMDSLSDDAAAGGPIEVEIAERSRLLIVAGEWPLQPVPGGPPERVPGRFEARQVRAHLIGGLVVRGSAPAGSDDAGACFVNGLLIEGPLVVAPGHLRTLGLAHCTVIPGQGAITVQPGGNAGLSLTIDRCLCAAIGVPGPIRSVAIVDSIVAGPGGSPGLVIEAPQTPLSAQRTSCFGAVTCLSLSASDCIFDGRVEALRRQTGCVRFSYLPPGSAAPRPYRCQPDLEIATRIAALRQSARPGVPPHGAEEAVRAGAAARVRPLFVSRDYGDPAYGQLELRCAPQIRSGAESGAEMGAFEFLKQPQREANLRDALDEYLRFGLEARLFFVT